MAKSKKRPAPAEAEEQEDSPPFATAVADLAPPQEFEASLEEALAAVKSAVEQVFGDEGAWVMPFGSIIQGVHLSGSDLDLCMEVPGMLDDAVLSNGKPDNSKQVAALRRLMRKLPSAFHVIETRFWKHIKVPIMILGYKSDSNIEVETDISVGFVHEGVEKGFTDKLVRRVLARTPRALHTARLIKLWAKVEGLNKAYDGFLNSLGWTLLVIYFYEQRFEVTSDVLHEEEENERGSDGNNSIPPPLDGGLDFDIPPAEEIAEFFDMVVGFETWPEREEAAAWGISVVEGNMVLVPPVEKKYADQCDFFLEDPGIKISVDRSENVARSLKQFSWRTTLQKCKAAASTLRGDSAAAADDWLDALIKKAASKAEKEKETAIAKITPVKRLAPGLQNAPEAKRLRGNGWQPQQAWANAGLRIPAFNGGNGGCGNWWPGAVQPGLRGAGAVQPGLRGAGGGWAFKR